MVDEAKGGEAEGGTEAAGGGDIEGLDWSCLLMNVERITADPEDDDSQDIFSVKFQVDGLDANAEVDIIVSDAADAEVVAVALHTLHVAMTNWAKLIEHRRMTMGRVANPVTSCKQPGIPPAFTLR
ncbi:MAG: hypothetical protein ACRYGP_02595 [Janthinobacterium lividum]